MTLQRVGYWRADGQHMGYSYHVSRSDADRSLKNMAEKLNYEIEPIEVRATTAGILAALNKYGSHPDNG